MIISNDTLQLISIREQDIEIIRNWRNRESVSSFLLDNTYIGKEQQKEWFNKINHQKEIYFMIQDNGKKLGLVFAKNIDSKIGTFEGNIFMGELSNSAVVIKSVILLSDFFFTYLGFNIAYSKVKENNENALSIDQKLGYQLISKELEFSFYSCHVEHYLLHSRKLKDLFFRNNPNVFIQFDNNDIELEWLNKKNYKHIFTFNIFDNKS